ncbi:hypothetical protein F5148DRAFT_1184248 [Russula earlei]|uniref:Uncharacterized protein n=1 Tax=Russula earlei TaxID=71964 RepID=A0ACC0UDR6_9AGAM|nr:hypothetical protein F5148DRAFT_1184248 [Russula earlei]
MQAIHNTTHIHYTPTFITNNSGRNARRHADGAQVDPPRAERALAATTYVTPFIQFGFFALSRWLRNFFFFFSELIRLHLDRPAHPSGGTGDGCACRVHPHHRHQLRPLADRRPGPDFPRFLHHPPRKRACLMTPVKIPSPKASPMGSWEAKGTAR